MTVERGQGAWEADWGQQRCDNRFALPNLEWTSPNDSNSALDGPRVLHGGGERRKSTKSIRKLEPVLLPVLAEAREQASKGLAT